MQAGDCLGEKYELIRVLGRGGMGTVWLSRHRTLGTPCAVKILAGAFEPARVRRALREARVAARLESEHAVRILDAGTDTEGRPWLAMEHLRGHDLAALLALHGPLTPARAATLILGVCDAVAEAHHRGVVHRDLKPANLFLAERDDGSSIVKVLDFGIAKLLDEGPDSGVLTASGAMIGSPRYAAPEQIRSASVADARADIWSLGVTLYELLAGTTPFVGETSASVLAQIVADPVPPLRDRVAGLPPALLAIVDRCLQKDPGRRYPSVAKLASDLAPLVSERDRRPLDRILGWTVGTNTTTEDDPNVRPPSRPSLSERAEEGGRAAPSSPHDTAASWAKRGPTPSPQGPRSRGAWAIALGLGGALSMASLVLLRPHGASSPAVAPPRSWADPLPRGQALPITSGPSEAAVPSGAPIVAVASVLPEPSGLVSKRSATPSATLGGTARRPPATAPSSRTITAPEGNEARPASTWSDERQW